MGAYNSMLKDSVKKYLATSTVKTPFFLFIGDVQYSAAIKELLAMGLTIVPMSGFCGSDDKIPSVDDLVNYIHTADVNSNEKNLVVTGLGEFLALSGKNIATRTLLRLKDLNIGGAKVILLLRGLSSLIAGLQKDPRFDNRRYTICDDVDCDLTVTHLVPPFSGMSAFMGFKEMLMALENGKCGSVAITTGFNLDNALFSVHRINNAYDGIKSLTNNFPITRSCGTDLQWADLLKDLELCNNSLNEVFTSHNISTSLESDFYERISGSDYRYWLYFIYLKYTAETQKNGYLRYVLENTSSFDKFVWNILNAIIDVPCADKQFFSFYAERKGLVKNFPESDIADFVVNNRIKLSESIYRLTDTTRVEKEEIIAWISKNGHMPKIDSIYPLLALYLNTYFFKCSQLDDLLTEYFEKYKRQKLLNHIDSEFINIVNEYAQTRPYNRLPTRNEIIERIEKQNTFLYWLDALGVEYLSLIEALAYKRDLALKVYIARAELPTITAVNRDFFDIWQGEKEKNGELDDIKHGEKSGYSFTKNDLPIHLAKELDIIAAIMEKAATELKLRRCKRFLIVSDHGSSRLAVLMRKEEKYDTDTSGEHSGRCCKIFQPYDLPFAAEENGYLVLADYGRFKGSRAASVEAHGGASLEEVVIPIIELYLKDESITVKLVEEIVTVDFRNGIEITLFFDSPVINVSLVLAGKSYSASQLDSNHYMVKLSETKKAGDYSADVYAGDNFIDSILIKAQGKSGKVNDSFEDLF